MQAFDHNLRGAAVGSWMNKSEDNGKTAPLDEQVPLSCHSFF